MLSAAAHAAASEQVLAGAEWQSPATIEEAAARPALHRTVAAYLAESGGWVRIAHAGGARGSAWAHEVRAWLIALGVPGAHIQIDPGMAEAEHLRLAVHAEAGRL
jgi:hypothetical protein